MSLAIHSQYIRAVLSFASTHSAASQQHQPHGLQPSTTQIPVREQSQSSEALRTAHEESLHAEQDYFTALHGTVVLITNIRETKK